MIKINLLSPVDKLNIKWEKINRLAVYNYAIVILIQVFFVFILLVAAGYLNIENKKLDKQLDNMQLRSEVKEINSIKKKIIKYNNQSDALLGIQEKQLYWTKILDNFSQIVSPGIRINNISIEPESGGILEKNKTKKTSSQDNTGNFKVVIIGVSKTMEDLLNFENNLKNSEIFINFNIDPKNYDGENFRYALSVKREDVISN
jgi:Tfp pilus assembly protein PilN